MVSDVKQTYFYTPVRSEMFIELPDAYLTEEDRTNNMVGLLNLSMYDTREAATTWADKVN